MCIRWCTLAWTPPLLARCDSLASREIPWKPISKKLVFGSHVSDFLITKWTICWIPTCKINTIFLTDGTEPEFRFNISSCILALFAWACFVCFVQVAGVTHRSRLLCSWVLRGTDFELKLKLVPALVLAVTRMFSIDFCMFFYVLACFWLALVCFG